MKLQIIVGSTRPGRVSEKIALWVAAETKNNFDEVEIVDLLQYKLPFFDELMSPQFNPKRDPAPEVQTWLNKVNEADAYVLVTPEYNRSTSAVLKNALDHLDFQFTQKPVALVGHGSTGGAQAVSHLRGIIPGVQSFTIPSAVYLSASSSIDDSGVLDAEVAANPYGPQAALKKLATEIKWYAAVLSAARA